MKNEKNTWVFIFQKYGKFWSVLLEHFIKHKPLISEEWLTHYLKAQIEMYTLYIYVPICTVISEINSSNEGSSIFECVLDTPFFNEGFFFNFILCGPDHMKEVVIPHHTTIYFVSKYSELFFGCTYNIGRMVAVGHLPQNG